MTAGAVRRTTTDERASVFNRVGTFLAEHRLSPEPANYAFAYRVVAHPDGVLAQAVAKITDDGVRLSRHDIATLGGEAATGAPLDTEAAPPSAATTVEDAEKTDALIARTKAQVDDFADTVRTFHAETTDFGRDLVASAAAIQAAGGLSAIDEVARITGAMIERVRSAETELARAQGEADRLREALEEARGTARRDHLTGLANRRAFEEAYVALPVGTTVAIAVCDIDHFKRVNDEFGHALGDRVLKAVGQTLAEECDGHLVARHGGEEFAILMGGLDVDAAWAMIDRARSAVAARRLRSRDTDTPLGAITLSAGIAAAPVGTAREALLAHADAALYRAKAAGRNRAFRAPEFGA